MAERHQVSVRRAYEDTQRGDGTRVLVDRLWPRGLKKTDADFDEWRKEIAPSTELRTWYNHDPDRFDEFARRYRIELDEPERAEVVDHLRALARHGNLTLITSTKRADISEATVLADLLNA